MPLISSDLVGVHITEVYHPTQKDIESHIDLTSRVIEELIQKRFNLQLSCACTSLMRNLMVEMCDITLFEDEKLAKGADDAAPKFTCLTILIATVKIFHQLVDRNLSIETLVDITSHDREDNFDIDEYESEDEIVSVSSLNSSDSEDSAEKKMALSSEQSIFAAFSFALMMAHKIYYDEFETSVVDVFDVVASLYKKQAKRLDRILQEERQKGFAAWGINRDSYENAIKRFKQKFNPLSSNDLTILANLDEGLTSAKKRAYHQIVAKMKLLTSLVYYDQDNQYTFTLFHIEKNALKVIQYELNLSFSFSDAYQFIEKAQEFTDQKLTPEHFEHFLRDFGRKGSHCPTQPPYEHLQYMFNIFKFSNPLRRESDPLSLSESSQQEIPEELKLTRRRKIQSY